MKSFSFGALVVAVALASSGSDASAAVGDGNAPALLTKVGPRHAVTLAKAKKRKRPASSGASKANSGSSSDDSDAGDDDSGKSASASSDSTDDAKEDELLGGSAKKKKAAPVAASSSSDDDSASGGGESSKASSKSVETVSSKASEEESGASIASALEFGLGAKAMFRQLSWTADARAAGLGPYKLTPGPETGLWLEFYPAAFGTSGFAANVGLIGRFDYGFGVATTLANGMDAATKFRDFLAGVKVRIPVGTFIPNVSVAYGQQVFEIAQQGSMTDLPQLAYQFVRPALGARLILAPTVAADITAAYLLVLDPGSGADHLRSTRFFPNASSYGIDVSGSVGFKLSGAIGARAGIDWRQYGISLKPDSNTRSVTGAVDRYIVAWAGIEVVLDGQGGAAGGDDEPVKPSKRSRRRHAEPKDDDDSSSDDSSSKSSDDE
ncbi:MAG TPA: hypothetical protein VN903_33380 [Polyangia bacterium]|jgi:hypothetical protein|nr:hypothetical protein [Polyangia bacterium]